MAPGDVADCRLNMNSCLYRDPLTEKITVSRRSGHDRRDGVSIFLLSYLGPLRRKRSGRRDYDTGYVDVYDLRSWFLSASVMLLCLIDALLTQQLLRNGLARELNPIMDTVIGVGGMPAFYGIKGISTIIAVSVIMLHKEWPLGKIAARICLWAYILLSLYHLYLLNVVQKLWR